MRRKNMQYAHPELAVLALLAPDTCRSVHQWRERAVGSAQGPDTGELVRINRSALANEADRRRSVASFLDGGFNTRSQRIRFGIVVAPQAAMLDADGFRKISCQRDE